MIYKYEVIEVHPRKYAVLKYNQWWLFKWKSWVNDGRGLRDWWSDKTQAEEYVRDLIEYNKHKWKIVKTYEVV